MKKSNILFIKALLVLAMFPLLQGCLETKARPDNWLAKVGSEFITMDLFDKRLTQLPDEVKNQLQNADQKKAMLQQLISEQLLFQAAKDSKVEQTQAYKEAVKTAEDRFNTLKRQTMIAEFVKNNVAKDVKVNNADIKSYFDSNPNQFASFERRKASHILVKTREEALAVKSKLRKGAAFETLAKELSLDPASSQNGGDLGGWVAKGQLEKNFEDALFAMQNTGDVSSVVETKFGFHLIKLSDKQIVPKRNFDQVKDQIQQFLTVGKQREALESYVETLKETYQVETNEKSFN